MARTFYHTTYLPGDDDTEIEVEYTATGGCDAHMGSLDYSGHPSEAPEIELLKARRKADGVVITLSDADSERIQQEIAETHEDPSDDDWDW